MDHSVSASMRDLLERRQPRTTEGPQNSTQLPSTSADDYQAFANGRIGNRPQLSLIFRLASGAVYGFSYTHLFSVESENPDAGCLITFSAGKSIRLHGRNLARLFDCICVHKAAEIVEADRSHTLQTAPTAPVVLSIEIPVRRIRPE